MLQPTGTQSPAWLRLSGRVIDIDALMRSAEIGSSLWHPVSEVAREACRDNFLDYLVPPPFEGSLPRRLVCRQGDGPIGENRVPPAFVFLWRELDGEPLLLIGTGNPWQWRPSPRVLPAQPKPPEEVETDRTRPTLFSPPIDREQLGIQDPSRFARTHELGALTYSAHRRAPIHDRLVMYRAGSHFTNMEAVRGDFATLVSLVSSTGPNNGLVVPARFATAPGANLIVLSVRPAFEAPSTHFHGESAETPQRQQIHAAPLPGRMPPLHPAFRTGCDDRTVAETPVAVPPAVVPIPPRSSILPAAPSDDVPAPLATDDRGDEPAEATLRPPNLSGHLPRYVDLAQRAAQVARRFQPLHAGVAPTSYLPAIRVSNLSRRPTRALSLFTGHSGRHPRRLALVSVLAALAVGTLHVLSAVNVARAGDLRGQLQAMSADLEEARQVAGQVHELESLLANTASQVLSASSWIALLAALDEARPAGLHLTSVGNAAGSWVEVRGSAKSTHAVTLYLASLGATRTIDGADVTFNPDDGSVGFALRVAIDDAEEDSE